MKRLTLLALLALAACATRPRDPFVRGERALLADDLASALLAYDEVPVAHPRYPEARAAAAGVERRMRRGHEVLLDGLLLRAEWRDREALAQLRRAQEIWPGLPGIDALIAATEHRLSSFGAAPGDLVAGPVADGGAQSRVGDAAVMPQPIPGDATRPLDVVAIGEVSLPEVGPVPLAEIRIGGGEPTPEQADAASVTTASSPVTVDEVAVGEVTVGEVDSPPAGEDPVSAGLIDVERRLGRGELELAVAALLDLATRFPAEQRVRVHLVRVLHQRALVRYGHGALSGAIEDWQRVLELDPTHRLARNLLRSAQAEAAINTPVR